jgi:sensor domain CHASE-containing protein
VKLRTKLALAIIFIPALAGVLLFTGAYVILTQNFTHLEEEDAAQDIQRVKRAVESRLNSLGATVIDWSASA